MEPHSHYAAYLCEREEAVRKFRKKVNQTGRHISVIKDLTKQGHSANSIFHVPEPSFALIKEQSCHCPF